MRTGRGAAARRAARARTLEKEAARERVRELVRADLDPLVLAQIAKAKGISHLVIRNKKTGKFAGVTDPARIVRVLNGTEHEVFEI